MARAARRAARFRRRQPSHRSQEHCQRPPRSRIHGNRSTRAVDGVPLVLLSVQLTRSSPESGRTLPMVIAAVRKGAGAHRGSSIQSSPCSAGWTLTPIYTTLRGPFAPSPPPTRSARTSRPSRAAVSRRLFLILARSSKSPTAWTSPTELLQICRLPFMTSPDGSTP